MTLQQYIYESVAEVKKGDVVIVAKFRENPQLKSYVTLETGVVARINKNTITVDENSNKRRFSIDDHVCIDDDKSIYGSASYTFYTIDEAKSKLNGDTFDGVRLSSMSKEVSEYLQ